MRYRLLFGMFGALACALASLLAEAVFVRANLSQTLDDRIGRVLIFRSDIARRLENAGGKTGDIQISLAWNGHNDLDLWCVDPYGEVIKYDHKRSRSGGELDIDANAGPPYTNEPVENIYWPFGRAPRGNYIVQVKHFMNHGSLEPTAYRVVILERGRPHQFTGTIWPTELKTIYRFNTNTMSGAWTGLTLSLLRAAAVTGFWGVLLTALLALALAGGQQWLWKRRYGQPLLPGNRLRNVVLYSAALGLAAGITGQLLFSFISYLHSGWPPLVCRVMGWALLGWVVGRGLAYWVPNLPFRAANIAGVLAGILGACSFTATMLSGSDILGRILAASILGYMIGVLICPDIEPLEELDLVTLETEPFQMQALRLRPYRGTSAGALRGNRAPRNR